MILAITERYELVEKEIGFTERFYITKYFKDVFEKLNITLFPVLTENNLEEIEKICDGLILTGSNIDINPIYYGEEDKKEKIDEYKTDKKLIDLFYKKNKPILGICGGMQSINVHFGGSLYQDIQKHNLENTLHEIKIEKDSFLYKTYGTDKKEVNSFHHQAIKNVAQGFNVTAFSNDNTIEAIEKGNVIGVQWHPEKMNDLSFFKNFINL